jgi:predicted ATPase
MDLQPLSPAQTADLVGALSGAQAAPSRFGEQLFHQTGGNPFFIVETLRALFDQGTLKASDAGWTTTAAGSEDAYATLPIPNSVGLIVDARLDRLADESRLLLDAAAVLRRDFSFDLVQAACGLPAPAALDALDQLLTCGILREMRDEPDSFDTRYDFAHALVRDRVYGALSGARRQHAHRHVAGLLEAASPCAPDRVAYHYLRGGVRDRACAWSIRAGDAALRVYGGEDALAHYRTARQLAVTSAEELAALAGMGDAAMGLGRPAEAIDSYRAALPLASDDHTRADLERRIGRAEERRGAYDRALEAYAKAADALADAPASLAAIRVLDGIATVYLRLDRHAEAAALCEDGLARPMPAGDDREALRAEAWLRNTLGMARMHGGDFPAAIREIERSLELKRRRGDRLGEATLLNNLGVVFYHCGEDLAARERYAASLVIKDEIGDRYGAAIALTNLALMETHLGDEAAAEAHLAMALETASAVGAAWLMPEIHRVTAQLALRLGGPSVERLWIGRAGAAAAWQHRMVIGGHVSAARLGQTNEFKPAQQVAAERPGPAPSQRQ